MTAFDKDLDVRGLNCPLPILRAKKALAELGSGQVLRVLANGSGLGEGTFRPSPSRPAISCLSHDEATRSSPSHEET